MLEQAHYNCVIAPERLRNAIAKLVVDQAREHHRELRGKRREAMGWWRAGLKVGLPFNQLQRVCWGWPVRLRTVAKVTEAMVACGALPPIGDAQTVLNKEDK